MPPPTRLINQCVNPYWDLPSCPDGSRIIMVNGENGVRVSRVVHWGCGKASPPAEIDAQHPLDADRRTAIARLRVERLDQPAQRRPWHHALHLGQKRRPPPWLGIALKPRRRQCQLLHPPTPRTTPRCASCTILDQCLLQRFLSCASAHVCRTAPTG